MQFMMLHRGQGDEERTVLFPRKYFTAHPLRPTPTNFSILLYFQQSMYIKCCKSVFFEHQSGKQEIYMQYLFLKVDKRIWWGETKTSFIDVFPL
jgi:hypothetical protein